MFSDTAESCYKCDDFYHANDEGGLAWDDPEIGVEWSEIIGTYNGIASGEAIALGHSQRNSPSRLYVFIIDAVAQIETRMFT